MSFSKSDVVPEAIAKTGLRTIRRPTPRPPRQQKKPCSNGPPRSAPIAPPWDKTAEQLKVTAAELQALVKAHQFLFKRLLFRADREAAREDRRLARVVFRKQIGLDPTTQAARLSAQCLVNIDLTYYRHRNKKPPLFGLDPNDPKLKEAIGTAEFMSHTTHDERMQFLESFLEDHVKIRLRELGLGEHYQPKKDWLSEDDLRGFGGNLVPREPTPPTKPDGGQVTEDSSVTDSSEGERPHPLPPPPRGEGETEAPPPSGEGWGGVKREPPPMTER